MKVYVAYKRQEYGFSEPLAVFSTVELANVFEAGFDASFDSGIIIKEMVLDAVMHKGKPE